MHRITHNWNLKLLSLALAVMLWSHVRGEVNPMESAVVDVPLRVRVPSGFALGGATLPATLPATVSVTLRGPRLSLRDITGGALPNPLAPAEQSSKVVRGAVRAWLEIALPRAGRQQAIVKTSSFIPDVEASTPRPAEIPVVLRAVSGAASSPTAASVPTKTASKPILSSRPR